mmetsp:Transcript_87479/g.167774  ORF Transcript_87479/g.167774 Transcript_87479/m.167774 type:complete len:906 (-) Transcript_87479:63-2780(-)
MECRKVFKLGRWRRTLYEKCCSDIHIQKAPTRCFKQDSPYDEDVEMHSSSDSGEGDFESLGRPKTNLAVKQKQLEKKLGLNKVKTSDRSYKFRSEDASERGTSARRASVNRTGRDNNFSHEASFAEGRSSVRSSIKNSNVVDDDKSHLITAVKIQNIEEVKNQIRDRPETINYPDNYRQTPIFWAVGHGNMEVLQLLLQAQARVQGVSNKFGYTPLMRCVHYGHIEVAQELLNHSSEIDAVDKFGGTCLQVASAAGHTETINWILGKKKSKPLILHEDEDGRNPLHSSAKAGHSAVCELLLEASAKPNSRDRSGRTPILFSLARNDVDSAQQLITHQADVNVKDESGRPLLTILVINLIEHPEQTAILCGIATILEAQARVDERDHKENTALMIAVKRNHSMLCAVLAAYGADVLATDEQERNVIGNARRLALHEICNVLEEFGACQKHNIKNNSNNRALLRATYYGNRDACKRLLDRGADVLCRTKRGQQATDIAARLGYPSTLSVLRQASEEVKTRLAIEKKNGTQDEQSLQRCIRDLQLVSQLNTDIQVHLRQQTNVTAVEKLQQVKDMELSVKNNYASTRLLREFLDLRKKIILASSLKELRSSRAKERQRLYAEFCGALREWQEKKELDPKSLQAEVTMSVSHVLECKLTELELANPYTRKVEEAQSELSETVCLKVSDLHTVLFEEVSALQVFPDMNAVLTVDELQCPKCMLFFASDVILRDHTRYCQSRVRSEKERDFKETAKRRADSALHRLQDCVKMYRNRMSEFYDLLEQVHDAKKLSKKQTPEALLPLRGMEALLEAVVDLYAQRMDIANKSIKENTKKWFPNNDRAQHAKIKSCGICLVNPATYVGVHRERMPNHHIACGPCAYMLQTRIKRDELVDCTQCGKFLKAIQMAPI